VRKYSPRHKTLKVNGKPVKILDTESLSQYWQRVEKLREKEERV